MLINIKSRSIYFERLFYLVIARRNDEAISISTLLYLRKYSNTQILKYPITQNSNYPNHSPGAFTKTITFFSCVMVTVSPFATISKSKLL